MSRDFLSRTIAKVSGPTNGRPYAAPNRHRPPFPYLGELFGRENLSRARPSFGRGLRTLDRFPPFRNMKKKGKGAGGLQGGLRGRAPWRSVRQRLMRAFSALSAPKRYPYVFCPLTPAPLSPYFHPHSDRGPRRGRPLVFSMQRGAAISVAACRRAMTL